ncbi:MAG: hypothetical protein IJU52_06280 [Clostridia bacterium]|nr:hypothetical protein [Clostridia bacterium]
MKRFIAIILAAASLFFTVSLCSCSSKDENLDAFELLLTRPTIGDVNDKIGKYKDFEAKYVQKSTYGTFYQNIYTYKLSVCGIDGKLQGMNTTIGENESDSYKPTAWAWIEDIPESKVEKFKENVTTYFNEKLGQYTESSYSGHDAYMWQSGDNFLYMIIYDSDTIGVAVDCD